MANILPPPPVNDQMGSFSWLEWYRQLRNYVATSGSVPWYIINFAGSNITDIASRSHQQLQQLQGGTSGEMYHMTGLQHSAMSNSLELLCTTSSVTLPTTATLFNPTYTTVRAAGITYDSGTGEITFVNGGSYSMTVLLNATGSSSNKYIYFYVTEDTGSGHTIQRYTARSKLLTTTSQEQTILVSSNYFAAGTKLKMYVWSSAATITLNTTDIVAGTVTVPAARIMWSGSL